MEFILGGKYHGIMCDCGAEDCYPTNYIGFGVPNIQCNTCGKKWIVSPMTKLHVKQNVLSLVDTPTISQNNGLSMKSIWKE